MKQDRNIAIDNTGLLSRGHMYKSMWNQLLPGTVPDAQLVASSELLTMLRWAKEYQPICPWIYATCAVSRL